MALADTLDLDRALGGLATLPRWQRGAVFAAVFAAILGAYYALLERGRRAELARVRAAVVEAETKLAESRAVEANLERFMEEFRALEAKLGEAMARLPDSTELPALLTDITALGKEVGLEFHAFRPRPEVARGFYAEVPIEIEVTGRYHDVGRFFDRVAHLPRIVSVAALEMSLAGERDGEPWLAVKGVAKTYRFLDEEASGTGE